MQKGLENFSLRGISHGLVQNRQMQKEANHKFSERSLFFLLEILPNVKYNIIGKLIGAELFFENYLNLRLE
jgi:hypothetical protein